MFWRILFKAFTQNHRRYIDDTYATHHTDATDDTNAITDANHQHNKR